MINASTATTTTTSAWRLKAGAAIFVFSIILPVAGVSLVALLGLSATMTAYVSGALLVAGELLGITSVAIMGRPGYQYMKILFFAFIKRHGAPREISRARYNFGLVMFCIPILFGWLSIYVADHIPGFSQDPLPYAVGGDIMLLVSLFVLGGGFWDKLHSLFVHDAIVHFSEPPADAEN